MRTRLNVYFPPALAKQVDELAIRRRISRSAIVEAAVASYLSPDGADRMEAAFARRLDRLSRQVQRLERNTGLSTEALALFVRFWLSVTPPLPDEDQAAAQVKGRKRYEGLSRRSVVASPAARACSTRFPKTYGQKRQVIRSK